MAAPLEDENGVRMALGVCGADENQKDAIIDEGRWPTY
jgi:hypothetical protein